MKEDIIKIAVIGAGNNTKRNHLPHLKRLSEEGLCSLVAICDLDKRVAVAAAEDFNFKTAFHDPDELFEKSEIDAVFIGGTADVHYKYAMKATKLGIHVFVEKPPAPSFKHTLELHALAKKFNTIAVCGFNRRFEPGINYIKQQFPEGSRLTGLEGIFYTPSLNKKPPFEINTWFDANGIHSVDILLYIAGNRPSHIYSAYSKGSAKFDGIFSGILVWENNFHAVLSSHNSAGARKEQYIAHGLGVSYYFERGSVSVYKKGEIKKPTIDSESSFYLEHKQFIQAIRESDSQSRQNLLHAAEALFVASLINDGFVGKIDWSLFQKDIHIPVTEASQTRSSSILIMNPNTIHAHLPKLNNSFNLVFKEDVLGMSAVEKENVCAVITGREGASTISAEVLDLLPNLKVVGVVGASVKKYVPESFVKRNIPIINVADIYGVAVAEFNLMQALVGLKHASESHDAMRKGRWGTGNSRLIEKIRIFALKYLKMFRYFLKPIWNILKNSSKNKHNITLRQELSVRGGNNLKDKVIGLIGYGAVTREFITLLKLFDCQIKVHSEFLSDEEARLLGVESTTLDDALNSDVVSVHRGLSERTCKSIGQRELDQLKSGTILINASRGKIFNEKALIARLHKGDVFACLDVFETEPLPKKSALRKMPNVFLTSHIAGSTMEMLEDSSEILVNKLLDFLSGKKVNHMIQTPDFFKNMT